MNSFNKLTQPCNTVSSSAPYGFEPATGLILGNACNLTYLQYAHGDAALSESLISQTMGIDGTFTQIGKGFTTSESIGTGTTANMAGDYRTVPIGFAMNYTSLDGNGGFNIIALRGTRTYQEWINDAEAIPAFWHVGNNNGDYYDEATLKGFGMVHGGFYHLYNAGSNGQIPVKTKHDLWFKYEYSRPEGAIAQAIQQVCAAFDSNLPLYITGHSLGAGLAVICAMDVGVNYPSCYASGQLNMWNLAGPLVAAGIELESHSFSPDVFVNQYANYVDSSFRIVNAADIVPISPPTSVGNAELSLNFAHVTDNTLTYCDQTGSIGGNHACTTNYLAYLKNLAQGFS
ncbi:lipase family protein [Aliiglaciecola sp. LCG003]|uniref:lipase family protein n=1 Tax=Aliiglaciecola sp. LCG003 TaxID=3053655 RepID=UPI002573FE76|nr:lipase family protein [Aliiglaciecola sp. LCG003]WJG07625.1 lipase family protein [Aliiglaciecola sp. LCG003]